MPQKCSGPNELVGSGSGGGGGFQWNCCGTLVTTIDAFPPPTCDGNGGGGGGDGGGGSVCLIPLAMPGRSGSILAGGGSSCNSCSPKLCRSPSPVPPNAPTGPIFLYPLLMAGGVDDSSTCC
jgi:hypothetical protein